MAGGGGGWRWRLVLGGADGDGAGDGPPLRPRRLGALLLFMPTGQLVSFHYDAASLSMPPDNKTPALSPSFPLSPRSSYPPSTTLSPLLRQMTPTMLSGL